MILPVTHNQTWWALLFILPVLAVYCFNGFIVGGIETPIQFLNVCVFAFSMVIAALLWITKIVNWHIDGKFPEVHFK